MTSLPETSMDYGDLFQVLMGPVKARLIMTGIELGIFNRLETFLSAEAVARDTRVHPENTRGWRLEKQILNYLRKSLSPF